jgi:hypothetical protein
VTGRAYTMTVNEFDQLDRPLSTAYNYPGSGQDETSLHRYDRHFEDSLLIMGTTSLVSSLAHNHRGQLTRLNRPGTVLDTLYFYYDAAGNIRRIYDATYRDVQTFSSE